MKIGCISLFPEMFQALNAGITGRAIKSGLVDLSFYNPRDFATDKHRTVDDRPYGGGPGMVMQYAPLAAAIAAAKKACGEKTKVIMLSPRGRVLSQDAIAQLVTRSSMVLVSGRYEGIDERVRETHIDEEWSIGDYVLSGGELAAMVLIDAMVRLLPGALGSDESAQQDSFAQGLLDYPHYTRPEKIAVQHVPKVLTQGDHQAIHLWRLKQALGLTWKCRPDLLDQYKLSATEALLLNEYINELKAEVTHHE